MKVLILASWFPILCFIALLFIDNILLISINELVVFSIFVSIGYILTIITSKLYNRKLMLTQLLFPVIWLVGINVREGILFENLSSISLYSLIIVNILVVLSIQIYICYNVISRGIGRVEMVALAVQIITSLLLNVFIIVLILLANALSGGVSSPI